MHSRRAHLDLDRLYRADAIELLPTIEPASARLVLTDPPFEVSRPNNLRTMGRTGMTSPGTTAVAAIESGRRYICVEKDPAFGVTKSTPHEKRAAGLAPTGGWAPCR